MSGFEGFGTNQKPVIGKVKNSEAKNSYGQLTKRVSILLTEAEHKKFIETVGRGNASRVGRELILKFIEDK